MNSNETLHERHRSRLIEKYMRDKSALNDHELLELLLFHVIKRKNTNPIAHRLCKRFGSLMGVLEADPAELATVEGVGESTAFFLHQIGYFYKRAEESRGKTPIYDSVDAIGSYLISTLRGIDSEAVYLMLLDENARFLGFHKLTDGALTTANVDPREIAELAFSRHACRLVLAHNHPGASAEPSDDDVSVTRFLSRAFSLIDLKLQEHFVISDNHYTPLSHYLVSTDTAESE